MRYDEIEEIRKSEHEARTFEEVLKFNPYHGYHGYFSTAQGATSMTFRTKDPSKQHWADAAISREKERAASGGAGDNTPLPDGKKLGQFEQYAPMTREQANGGHVNPKYPAYKIAAAAAKANAMKDKFYDTLTKYGKDDDRTREASKNFDDACDEYEKISSKGVRYTENCQTCVYAYEARLRGYHVTARPWEGQSYNPLQYKLACGQHLGYFDPVTGRSPRPKHTDATTPEMFRTDLEGTVKPGQRYTMQFSWKGRARSGHIICVDRDDRGKLRLYDPQNGETTTGSGIDDYLNEIKYIRKRGDKRQLCGPSLLRVDNMEMNPMIAGAVFKEAK